MRNAEQQADGSRRYDLDWLRIFAVLLLIPFHSALIFILDPRYIVYIKDKVQSDPLIPLANFISLWHMPLFFVIAGASTWFALGHRNAGQYLKERVLRLWVPFVFGVIVIVPPMTYIRWLSSPNRPSFGQHYLGFFQINPADMSGYSGTFTPAHLWFILFLFVFSIVALPLFLWLRSSSGARMVSAFASFLKHPAALLLLFVPMTLAAAIPVLGDKNPIYYLLTFISGFWLMTDPRFQEAIDRDGWIYLLFSIVATPIIFQVWQIRFSEWSVGWIAVGILTDGLRWTWVLAILSFGHRYLNVASELLRYCREAAYPFYILHLPIDTLVAYFVIQWDASIAVKYSCIVLLTILLTLVTYDRIVRRTNVTRFLFGMKSTNPRSTG